jgi:very-short-patch-repair endonuclease
MLVPAKAPSSGPSGHLLPVGEKRELAKLSDYIAKVWAAHSEGLARIAAGSLFSPTGRRWPEGPDEAAYPVPNDDITKRRPGKTAQARRFRRAETEEEYRLWSDLRNRRLNGYKFSRQVPLGSYVVDFLCRERHLIIEIDGFHHAMNTYDDTRTLWLNRHGYSMLRFWNHEITGDRRSVLETILSALDRRLARRSDNFRFFPAILNSFEPTGEQQ